MSQAVAEKFRRFCPKCIDFHAHFLHPEVFEAGQPHSVSSCFGARMFSADTPGFDRMFEPELQIADMDERGVAVHVITSADVLQARNWADPAEEARLARLVNDQALSWVDRFPDRFIGTGVLPFGNMTMAMAELERVVAMGIRIINLPSNFRGVYLGHERFAEFWSEILRRNLVTFVHPEGVTDMWYQNYAMWNSIGQSIEEVRVMSSLIYEGVLDRNPGLKIVMAHGGGYMPHYMGRLDRNVTDKPFTAVNISKKPSEYLKDFYYDSCVYDPRTLELLVERVGLDRIVMGGDYPVAALDPIDFIDSTSLDDRSKAAIAGGNAIKLLE